MRDQTILQAMMTCVREAAIVARAVQRDLARVQQITKDDRSPVTVADFAVQAVVALGLRRSLGESPIVGEETAATLSEPTQASVLHAVVEAVRSLHPGVTPAEVITAIDACGHDATAPRYFTLDPIDGTKGFLRGQQYAISLGFIENGQVTLGVLGCPNLSEDFGRHFDDGDANGCLFVAARNEGAVQLVKSGTLQLSAQLSPALRDLTAAPTTEEHRHRRDRSETIRLCESVEKSHTKHSDAARIMQRLGLTTESLRLDSQCKYAVVARGQAEAYLRFPTSSTYVEKIWDHAAGMLVAQEAGVIVTDVDGRLLDFSHGRLLTKNRGIVCAVPWLHELVITASRSEADESSHARPEVRA